MHSTCFAAFNSCMHVTCVDAVGRNTTNNPRMYKPTGQYLDLLGRCLEKVNQQYLVGGFNPSKTYLVRQMASFPQGSGWTWNIFELPPPKTKTGTWKMVMIIPSDPKYHGFSLKNGSSWQSWMCPFWGWWVHVTLSGDKKWPPEWVIIPGHLMEEAGFLHGFCWWKHVHEKIYRGNSLQRHYWHTWSSWVFSYLMIFTLTNNQKTHLELVVSIWKICSSMWILSPKFGGEKKDVWNHHRSSNEQNPSCLGDFVGDKITRLHGDYFTHHEVRIPSFNNH